MGVRLRSAVIAARTGDGLTCRLGDAYLTVRGASAAPLLDRLRPHLNGRWSIDQLVAQAPPAAAPRIRSLLEALLAARMIYEALDVSSPASDGTVQSSGYHSRAEARGDAAARVCAAVRGARLLVVGREDMAEAVAEAAREAGITGTSVCVVEGPTMPRAVDTADIVILAGGLDRDLDWIAASRWPGHTVATRMALLSTGGTTLVAPLGDGPEGCCVHCLKERFGVCSSEAPAGDRATHSSRQIASRLLIQRLFDDAAANAHAAGGPLVHEVNAACFTIAKQPMIRSSLCPHCRVTAAAGIHAWPAVADDEPRQMMELLDAATSRLARRGRRGMLEAIGEADLVQIPWHQSAARWYAPCRDGAEWIVESGANAIVARVRALRTMLERYTELTLPANETPGGFVVSGDGWEDLELEAFFRLAACRADQCADWTRARIGNAIKRASPVWTYLADVGATGGILVERSRLQARGGLVVLRFVYEGERISVVAAPSVGDAWRTGITDVWLRVTGTESSVRACPTARYRRAAGDLATQRACMLAARPRVDWTQRLDRVRSPETDVIAPFVFAWATAVDTSSAMPPTN